MDATTSKPKPRRRPLLLQAVAHVEDADSDWLITLDATTRSCGPKARARRPSSVVATVPTASARNSSALVRRRQKSQPFYPHPEPSFSTPPGRRAGDQSAGVTRSSPMWKKGRASWRP